ncbi:DUF2799 domain-containing protein [Neomegalonema sp.]|uniref:DUF2799 domain-containing protein n=1 Tax=Neomegalonema sp. TaxID=2039713 RepID=UPI002621DF0E|nr:DUF2799 domain-containing protein [Neomegalonema sp.]MDD2868775.1 DUF2799 domain-containing protein [Neomegalonema sp.]
MTTANRANPRGLGLAAACLGGALLAGCASLPPARPLSQAQCAAIDWRGVGHDDGAAGAPSTELARHVAACPGLPQEAWAQGRAQGLMSYCTAENGYRLGRSGREYFGVCPAGPAEVFLREYERGLDFRRPTVVYAPSFGYGWGGRGPRMGWGVGWGWRSDWW